MNASDLLLAAAMLTAPVGTPEPVPCVETWSSVRDALHETAVKWEIMDPRETRYVLDTREDFEADLNLLRKRYHDLKDAPLLVESNRLPDRRTVNELIKFNREYRKNLEDRQAWESDRLDIINEAIKETDKCYRQWDAIRDAQCDFYYVTVRRAALLKYKEAVGEKDYIAGKVPPYVPEWRFANK